MQYVLSNNFDIKDISFPINKGKDGFKFVAEKKNLFDLSKV